MMCALKQKGKQGVRVYILNGSTSNFYVLYNFDAALIVSFVDLLWQQIWIDPEGWIHTYNTLEKRRNNFLSAFCASRFEMQNAF